jgi:hypothetical protein
VTLKDVQENLPRLGPCVGQRVVLVATCDAARALLPYDDQKVLEGELLRKPWTAPTPHRFPTEAEVSSYQVKFNTLTKKLDALWSLRVRRRIKRRDLRAYLERLFLVPKTTRWDSLFDVMRFIYERYGRSPERRRKLNDTLASMGICFKSGKSVQFTCEDMDFLKEYVQVRPLDYRCDNGRFWLYTLDCQA